MKNVLLRAQAQGAELSAAGDWLQESAENQIFGYQILAKDIASPPGIVFSGTQQTPSPVDHERWQLAFFASPRSRVRTCVSEEHKSRVFVWGIPAHPNVSRADIAAWCTDVIAQRRFERFRELLGTFVVVADEPEEHRITFVSDILGIRPLFMGTRAGRLVFGSDVWGLQRAGLTSGAVDYTAVASWIAFGCNCTGGSLFADVQRLPPGTALVFQDGHTTEIPYAEFALRAQSPTTEEAAEAMHEIISSSTKTLLAEGSPITLALSGGFDSRYLLALALRHNATIGRVVNVDFPREEGQVARQVADTLGVSLETFDAGKSVWDIYDQPYHFAADGFPISKQLSYRIAQQYPDAPMVNGFLGGILVRGHDDTVEGKSEKEWGGELIDALYRSYSFPNSDLFHDAIAKRIHTRSRSVLQAIAQQGIARIGKAVEWSNLYNRQRHYISNNFLQHLSVTEALLPFYSWELISYKVAHEYAVFNDDVFITMFRNHFPALADIGHSDYLRRDNLRQRKGVLKGRLQRWASWRAQGTATSTRQWALELLPLMARKDWLSCVSKKRCTLLIAAAIAGHSLAENSIFALARWYLLEQRAKDAGLDFQWERM